MSYAINFVRSTSLILSLFLPMLAGCSAFKPMTGVPARYIPDDLKVGHRNGKRTIDLSLLSQRWNGVHLVDSGDVLGIYIGGILGKIDENPPVQIPQNSEYQPAAGVPVTVREDGTISLPMIKALPVRGMTMCQTEDAIREAYTNHKIGNEFLPPGGERILVSLQRPRQTHVMVVRQDSSGEPLANAAIGLLNIGTAKRGTGKVVSLSAYKNDVLNALLATNGLPGLDAENAVYIIRRQPGGMPTGCPDPNAIDPSTLIRQTKAAQAPIIRSQNWDGWNDRNRDANFTDDAATNSYQQPSLHESSPFAPNRNMVRGWGDQQAAANPIESSDSLHADDREGNFGMFSRENGNPNGNQLIPAQWNGTNGQVSPFPSSSYPGFNVPQSPTPLTSAPPLSPTPQAPNYSNDRPAVPNDPPSMGRPNLSGPGYSITDIPVQPQYPDAQHGLIDDQYGYDNSSTGKTIGVGIADGRRIIRIPIRLGPDEQVDIKPEDVILQDGDIVFIESRDTEVFFTGGLLGGGQYTLPRDFDLDILQALSIATSRAGSGGGSRQMGGVTALNSDVTISPSNVVVIRKLPEGGEVPIKVDLYRARSDFSERLIVQPGDYIYLQYTPLEAVCAFLERHLLEGALFGVLSQQAVRNN